ncbi:MAG TPA: FAD-dependent oxidoreductase [Bacteroidales bacterium]|nr:FAD-dependent oxidoreductase [Bacteroidales bacterium]
MKRKTFLASAGMSLLGLGTGRKINPSPEIISKKRSNSIKTSVLVVGGGPAGIGAAIGSAKAGARTLLIENYGFFGGVASWGMGMCLNQMRPDEKERGFVHELLLKKLQNYGDQAVRISTHQFFVNTEYLKVAVLDALDEVGCDYLVHAKAVEALTHGNRIEGVLIATKSGLVEIFADVVVDCTGDADIAYFADAPTMKETGNLSPQTLLFNISNVNNYSQRDTSGVYNNAKSKYPLIPAGNGSFSLMKVSNSRHFYVNHSGTRDMGNFDVTDPFQFSTAECLSRRQVIQMVEAMREFGEGEVKKCEIVASSNQIGVRESRRIKGEYVLTEEDAMNGSRFDDVIAWRSGWLDIGYVKISQMKIHQVPYRSIVPEKIDCLLAAGRCISTDHAGLSAGKSMGNCFATGHAAGIAAALSSKLRTVPRELDVRKIQESLKNDGVDLSKGGEDQDSRMAM